MLCGTKIWQTVLMQFAIFSVSEAECQKQGERTLPVLFRQSVSGFFPARRILQGSRKM